MEYVFYPAGFGVSPGKVMIPNGSEVDTMTVLIQDAGGVTVKIIFGDQDWIRFQEFVADHEKAAKAAVARRAIALPDHVSAPWERKRTGK